MASFSFHHIVKIVIEPSHILKNCGASRAQGIKIIDDKGHVFDISIFTGENAVALEIDDKS